MVSIKLLFVKQTASVLQTLLDAHCKFVGTIVRDWVIPCLFKYHTDPFKINLRDPNHVDRFFKALQSITVQVVSPITVVGSTLSIRGLEYKHEMSIDEAVVACRFDIMDDYGSHQNKFSIEVIEKSQQPLMDVDQFVFSDAGITNMACFNMHTITNALNRTCTLIQPIAAGIEFTDFKKRKAAVGAIFDKIKNKWTVTGVPFNVFVGPPVTEKTCLSCQSDITGDHAVLLCRCNQTTHVECLESWVSSELEQRSYFKCPGCRDRLSFE